MAIPEICPVHTGLRTGIEGRYPARDAVIKWIIGAGILVLLAIGTGLYFKSKSKTP